MVPDRARARAAFWRVVPVVSFVLLAVACGDEGQSSRDASPVTEAFPAIEVADVATGETIDLADELAGGELPVLLWFWAPH